MNNLKKMAGRQKYIFKCYGCPDRRIIMKSLLFDPLLIVLLTVFINAAGAENTAAKTQVSTSQPVATAAEAASSQVTVIGNKDSKRYHLPGMPYYNKVEKYHRVYFNSEQQAIDKGYYKAGTGKDLSGSARRSRKTIRNQAPPAAADYSVPEKSLPEALQKNDKKPEIKTPDTPKTVKEPLKPAGDNIQGKTVNKETVIDAPVKPPSPMAGVTTTAVVPKVELNQKSNVVTAQEGVFLKREGNTMQLDKIDLSKERPRRLEVSYSFDNLNPNEVYGDWHSGQLAFYHTLSPDFTYFVMGALMNRNEGSGGTGTAGAYVGWTSFLYTCTSVTVGTHSTYLPEFRIDHDFNFSVWPSRNLNFLTGISYIDYFDDHSGLIFSGGPMITFEKFVLHYRLFYNISYPGSISSFSHLISLGYGEEGWQWTHLNVSFGKQAYLATYIATPQEVNQNSLSLNLRHRHWLGKYYGIFSDVSYFKLDGGYEKYGIGLGAFYEF